MRIVLLILTYFFLISAGCGNQKGYKENPGFYKKNFELGYSINQPDTVLYLDRALSEISGLSYNENKSCLVTINDEDAFVFYLSPTSGRIIDKVDFGKPDDYEAITCHGDYIYISESNGNIKVVNDNEGEKINEYNTDLDGGNDIEGMVYNAETKSFLLAAKGDSEIDDNEKGEKSVFEMKLDDDDSEIKKYFSLDLMKAVDKLESMNITQNTLVNLSVTSRLRRFSPSAMAIHPKTNDLYILSFKGRLLVVTDNEGNIKAITFLNQKFFPQPEGICFGPDLKLYVSSEGRSKNGTINIYSPIDSLVSDAQ